jgi:hypothetical protein
MTATIASINTALPAQVAAAAAGAGLTVLSASPAVDFSGNPTTRFTLALASDTSRTQQLELSQSFDLTPQAAQPDFGAEIKLYFAEAAIRLRNPRPDCYLTLHGIPLSFSQFGWPFHESSAGADTSVVHGQINLEDGESSVLHAKIAAAMTLTFREIVPAPEQPFAEAFLFNAVRKTLDQGQLELVKSGNRQPVPITTRFYSSKQRKFNFNDTTPAIRESFLASKTFWLSGVLGSGAPVWLLDPRDAQYLNCTLGDLKTATESILRQGLIQLVAPDHAFAAPTEALMQRKSQYYTVLREALAFIKPTFNEEMRSGHTNM